MVCGSIGYGGIDDIRRIYTFLDTEGFDIVDHIVGRGMDYSDIKDFRNKKKLSRQIVNHDLEYVKKADVLVVLANMPSYGAAIEMFVAKNSGKKIVLLAKDPVPTPWSINFSDYVVTTEEELIKLLWDLKKGVTY
ncbi:MAG: hypothetical protein FIO02_10590 [Nitrosopumilales archaeon]|jgi:hypothetical protein|nr:hypothetical protein [Nitrosopumilales archaeon]MRN61378.1 hypothetical protein [Nitrosopumilales archaeon]